MGAGYCILLLAVPFNNKPVGFIGVIFYALGLLGYTLTNAGFLTIFILQFARTERVVTSMLDGLWRKEKRRLIQLADGPIDMAAARGRWIKVQAQVLDRRVASVALFGAGILAISKILEVYTPPFVEPEWVPFIKILPHVAAFSTAIPALLFHGLATKLIRLEHQVSEVAAAGRGKRQTKRE